MNPILILEKGLSRFFPMPVGRPMVNSTGESLAFFFAQVVSSSLCFAFCALHKDEIIPPDI